MSAAAVSLNAGPSGQPTPATVGGGLGPAELARICGFFAKAAGRFLACASAPDYAACDALGRATVVRATHSCERRPSQQTPFELPTSAASPCACEQKLKHSTLPPHFCFASVTAGGSEPGRCRRRGIRRVPDTGGEALGRCYRPPR